MLMLPINYWMTSPASAQDLLDWERRLGIREYPDGSYAQNTLIWRPDEVPERRV